MDSPNTVFVVDDDDAVRQALQNLLRSAGLQVKSFGTVREFLGETIPKTSCCAVVDVRLPEQSGFDLQDELRKSDRHLPVIFLTGHGDIRMSVRAMKAGAVEFLEKPFRDQDLLDAVQAAIARDRTQQQQAIATAAYQEKYEALTPREREIMALVTTGLLNKQIAGKLGISEVTVKVHRGQMMRKMTVRSLAELVKIAEKLRLSSGNP